MRRVIAGREWSVGRYVGEQRPGRGAIGIQWMRLGAGWYICASLGPRWAGVHLAWWRT